MKLTYLGTAAAEGFPAVFCHCAYCNEARRLGGKNIRTRSQAIVNDDLLIDLPADTYSHFLSNGIEGDKIPHVILTHAHPDHLYPTELAFRNSVYAHDMQTPTLTVYGSSKTLESIPCYENIHLSPLRAFESVTIGKYRVTPLPAKHMLESEAFIYIIQGDKTILYAHDTGYFYDEVFSYIEKNKITFDLISLDCTYVNITVPDEECHMGFPNILRCIKRLTDIGAVNEKTLKYANHFSHNGNPIHHLIENISEKYDMCVSYDGCAVEF